MILFSDFDDTLRIWNNPDQFSRNLAAIKKFREAGNQFCLATGRSLSSVVKVFPDFPEYCDFLILDNGGVCVDSASKIVFTLSIDSDAAKRLTAKVRDLVEDMVPVYYYDLNSHQDLVKPPTKIRYWTKTNDLSTEISTKVSEDPNFLVYTYHDIKPSMDWLPEEYLVEYIAYSEVMSSLAGKESAVAKLAAMFNFPHSEIITVGDDWNDLKMIQKFNGYIIAGSKPEVLSHVAPEHVVSSVADLINNLLK